MATSDRKRMLVRRARLTEENPDIKYASEMAPLMGDLEREYWDWQLENSFAELMNDDQEESK
jgi:hypothetical protein